MLNVLPMPGREAPTVQPNADLVRELEFVLAEARAGKLQSFLGTGFTGDGSLRYTLWCDSHDDVYQMLGALAWLQHEYVERHTCPT